MTKNAATEGKLGQLHAKVADVMLSVLNSYDTMQRVVEEKLTTLEGGEELPQLVEPSASLLGAITKFLKDNDVTCQPEENAALSDLERRLEHKRANRGNVVALRDVAVAE